MLRIVIPVWGDIRNAAVRMLSPELNDCTYEKYFMDMFVLSFDSMCER